MKAFFQWNGACFWVGHWSRSTLHLSTEAGLQDENIIIMTMMMMMMLMIMMMMMVMMMGYPANYHQSHYHQVGFCHNDEGWE